MAILYVFVDESGDLGKHGSNFFVIACLSTTEPKHIERIIKKVRERKLKKKMREISELKANSSNTSVRIDVLERLAESDCEISLIVVDKKQIRDCLYNAKNRLYNYVFGLLIKEMHFYKSSIDIIIDQKESNRLLREDLDKYIAARISELTNYSKTTIKHLESHEHKALQVIDFVAWATHRKYSFNDDYYFNIFKSKISTLIELWKNKEK